MKRFLPIRYLSILLLAGSALFAGFVPLQVQADTTSTSGILGDVFNNPVLNPAGFIYNTASNALGGGTSSAVNCTNIGGFLGNVVFCALNGVGYAIFEFVNLLLSVAGWFFNIAVQNTVFQFGSYFGNSAGLLHGWAILRDIANMVLLFGFVFIGIATILDIHGYEVKKTLPRLIIFAILMNFSLLASEGVIDISNAFASVLYAKTAGCGADNGQTTCNVNTGISAMIMTATGYSTAYSLAPGTTLTAQAALSSTTPVGNVSPGFSFYLLMSIFGVILAMVLVAGALLLVSRALVLAFLMVLAPLGFAGFAVPPLEKYARTWWDKLLSQAFFAPIFLLLLFIGLAIGQGFNGGGNLATLVGTGSLSAVGEVLIFALMIGFVIAALMMAKQMGVMGANFAINLGRQAVTLPFVPGALGAQWGASKARNWYNTKVGQLEKNGGAGKGVVTAARFLGIDQGIDSALKKTASAKIGGFASYEDRRKELAERKKETSHAAEIAELKDALASGDEQAAAKLAQKMNQHGIEEAIKQCNADQLEVLGKILTVEMYGKIVDNKDTAENVRESFMHGRFGELLEDANIGQVKNLSKEDAGRFAQAFGDRFAELLERQRNGSQVFKEDQLDALKDDKHLTAAQRADAKQSTIVNRVEAHIDAHEEDKAYNLILNERMSSERKAKLKHEALTSKAVQATFDQKDIQALVDNKSNSLTGAEMVNLANYARGDDDGTGSLVTARDAVHAARMKGVDNSFKASEFLRGAYGQTH